MVGAGEHHPDEPAGPEYKQCPDCAEQVLAAAHKCRYCGFRFDGGRRERRSLLPGLLSGLRDDATDSTLPEILADWGIGLHAGETADFFALVMADGRPGYLLVSSQRLVFFRAAPRRRGHEKAFEYPLSAISDARILGGPLSRRLEVNAGGAHHRLHGARREQIERLGAYLTRGG